MKEAAVLTAIVLAVVIPIALRSGYTGELWAAWSVLAAYGAQVEAAEFRLTRSVETNIGRQKLIQKLRRQVNELKEQATMGHC